MPIFQIQKTTILFIHIPKTGGTTIETELNKHGRIGLFNRFKGILPCPPQHFHYQYLTQAFDLSYFDYAFSIVRNPYSRLFSEYRYRMALLNRTVRFDKWWGAFQREYAINRYAHENHVRPQTDFIGPGVKWFKFEQGLENPLTKALGHAAAVPRGPMQIEHKKASKKKEITITPSTLRSIKQFYRTDFDAFGYDTSYTHEAARDGITLTRKLHFLRHTITK